MGQVGLGANTRARRNADHDLGRTSVARAWPCEDVGRHYRELGLMSVAAGAALGANLAQPASPGQAEAIRTELTRGQSHPGGRRFESGYRAIERGELPAVRPSETGAIRIHGLALDPRTWTQAEGPF